MADQIIRRPSIAVVGCGYWGSRHVRVGFETPAIKLSLAVDPNPKRLDHIRSKYRGLRVSSNVDSALQDRHIDAVIIATPISTHYTLARSVLEAGKHVLIEKPMAMKSSECQELARLANERGLVLMVGHTFEYHPAVELMRQIIRRGELGDIYYISSRRLNLGLYHSDCNVLWDLAPHDFSIIFLLLEHLTMDEVNAWGFSHVLPGVEDVVYATMRFRSGETAHIHVSWLDPVKVRQVTVVGSEGMLVFDDAQPAEKIRIYDKRFKPVANGDTFADFQLGYHLGDVRIPTVPDGEPLKVQLMDFVTAIRTGGEPRANWRSGLRAVQALERASAALACSAVERPFDIKDAVTVPALNGQCF